MKTLIDFGILIIVTALSGLCHRVEAGQVANPSISGITDSLGGSMYIDPVVGFDFTPTKDLQIDYLGAYDDASDGFYGPHTVGLFIRQTGQMLATATLDNGSFLENTFRWERVPRVTLQAGVVYNIADYNWAEDRIYSNWAANLNLTPDITGVQGYIEVPTTGLHMPTRQGGPTAVFIGPAFRSVVPEPATSLLICVGGAIFGWRCTRSLRGFSSRK